MDHCFILNLNIVHMINKWYYFKHGWKGLYILPSICFNMFLFQLSTTAHSRRPYLSINPYIFRTNLVLLVIYFSQLRILKCKPKEANIAYFTGNRKKNKLSFCWKWKKNYWIIKKSFSKYYIIECKTQTTYVTSRYQPALINKSSKNISCL